MIAADREPDLAANRIDVDPLIRDATAMHAIQEITAAQLVNLKVALRAPSLHAALQFNQAVSQMQHRMQALDSLKAIDHLLLASGDLEQ